MTRRSVRLGQRQRLARHEVDHLVERAIQETAVVVSDRRKRQAQRDVWLAAGAGFVLGLCSAVLTVSWWAP